MKTTIPTHLSPEKISHLSYSTFHQVNNQCLSLLMHSRKIREQKNKDISYLKPVTGYKDLYCLVNVNNYVSRYHLFRIIPNGKHFAVVSYDSETNMLSHYSEHVFIRYCQRLHLVNLSPKEQLIHFLKNFNNAPVRFAATDENGMKLFEKKMFNGIIYGAADTVKAIYYHKTFMPYNFVH